MRLSSSFRGRIDVGDLVHQMQQIADGRADGERDVAGACLEHGVPGAHVMQAGDLLNDVANLGEDGLAIEVDDPLAVALHVAPLADPLPHPVAVDAVRSGGPLR